MNDDLGDLKLWYREYASGRSSTATVAFGLSTEILWTTRLIHTKVSKILYGSNTFIVKLSAYTNSPLLRNRSPELPKYCEMKHLVKCSAINQVQHQRICLSYSFRTSMALLTLCKVVIKSSTLSTVVIITDIYSKPATDTALHNS